MKKISLDLTRTVIEPGSPGWQSDTLTRCYKSRLVQQGCTSVYIPIPCDINTFCKAIDPGKEVRAVFCDISKAFDRVWHAGLLYNLRAAGVTGEVLAWFKSYLSNRRQRVVIPGATSDWVFIRA